MADQCNVCLEEKMDVADAGDVLRSYTLEHGPCDFWVKICGSCTAVMEEMYGPPEPPQPPSVEEDWDLYLAVQDHLPFAKEDME